MMGDKILRLRKARGWSQEELADRLGVTRQAVGRWESNSAKPEADKIVDLCDLFGVSADYLLRDNYSEIGEPSHPQADSPARGSGITVMQIQGIVLIIVAVLLFCALAIMSAVNPHLHTINGETYRGLLGYILGYDLWWLVIVDVALFIGGVVLLFKTELRRFFQYLIAP